MTSLGFNMRASTSTELQPTPACCVKNDGTNQTEPSKPWTDQLPPEASANPIKWNGLGMCLATLALGGILAAGFIMNYTLAPNNTLAPLLAPNNTLAPLLAQNNTLAYFTIVGNGNITFETTENEVIENGTTYTEHILSFTDYASVTHFRTESPLKTSHGLVKTEYLLNEWKDGIQTDGYSFDIDQIVVRAPDKLSGSGVRSMLPMAFQYIPNGEQTAYNISLMSVKDVTYANSTWHITVLMGTTRLEKSRARHADYEIDHHYHTWPAFTGQILDLPSTPVDNWMLELYFETLQRPYCYRCLPTPTCCATFNFTTSVGGECITSCDEDDCQYVIEVGCNRN